MPNRNEIFLVLQFLFSFAYASLINVVDVEQGTKKLFSDVDMLSY